MDIDLANRWADACQEPGRVQGRKQLNHKSRAVLPRRVVRDLWRDTRPWRARVYDDPEINWKAVGHLNDTVGLTLPQIGDLIRYFAADIR